MLTFLFTVSTLPHEAGSPADSVDTFKGAGTGLDDTGAGGGATVPPTCPWPLPTSTASETTGGTAFFSSATQRGDGHAENEEDERRPSDDPSPFEQVVQQAESHASFPSRRARRA